MAAASPFGFDAALFGLRLGLDDDLGLLGLGRSFDVGPAFGLDALGLGQRGLGHGPVLRFLHRGLGFALAASRPAGRPRPSSPASAWATAISAWATSRR